MRIHKITLVMGALAMSSGCATDAVNTKPDAAIDSNPPLIRYQYPPKELTRLCNQAVERTEASLTAIAAIPTAKRSMDNTLLAFERTLVEFSDTTSPLTFMKAVSTEPGLSAEGAECDEKVSQFSVKTFTRRDLYNAIKDLKARGKDEARLLFKTKQAFEQSGLKLDDAHLAEVKELQTQLALKSAQFGTNLNNDKSTVLLSAQEIEGLPKDYVADLVRGPKGEYVVNVRESDADMVLKNVSNSETRRRFSLALVNRGGDANVKLLEDAIVLREKIALILGYPTWADYRTEDRMAKNKKNVLDFLNNVRSKLSVRNRRDLAKLLAFKKESFPQATKLDPWDVSYYSYQLKKRDFQLDNEQIREYFPADVVVNGLFEVYSKMLGIHFTEIGGAKVWAQGVKLYEIHDNSSGTLIGHFYTDLFPRPGKYGHAAAFTLLQGYELPDGKYSMPVSSIVANLNPPMNGKPSLLNHDDVETIFHEFGHIMHQTLTRAKYASLSGSSVAQDFVEAPSQMLENWVWSPKILNILSGHYLDHSKKLPADLLQRMIAARDFNQGVFYTKQLLYGLYDMELHSQTKPVDSSKLYSDLYAKIVGLEPMRDMHFGGSFGHLMGGYDSGYYGYLWSKVYAEDMFSRFPKEDLTSPKVGVLYRKTILERGNMVEAADLLKEFLGREPNSKAFFKSLHIQ